MLLSKNILRGFYKKMYDSTNQQDIPPSEETKTYTSPQKLEHAEIKDIERNRQQQSDHKFKLNELKRRVIIIFTYFVVGAIIIVLFIWLYHILAPKDWYWLKMAQITTLQNYVVGGILSNIGTLFIYYATGEHK